MADRHSFVGRGGSHQRSLYRRPLDREGVRQNQQQGTSHRVFDPARRDNTTHQELNRQLDSLASRYKNYGKDASRLGRLRAQYTRISMGGDIQRAEHIRIEHNQLADDFRRNYMVKHEDQHISYAEEIRQYNIRVKAYNNTHSGGQVRISPLETHISLMNNAYNKQESKALNAIVVTNVYKARTDWVVRDL